MDFQTFRSKFKGDLITPSDEGYEQAIQRWARNAVKRAAVVAYVKDTDDIALALKYVQANGIDLAIHSGGHSPAGNSSTEGGLVIDLARYFYHVRVDPNERLAYVGGGAKWGTFDRETMKHGLAGVAGTVHHTGVGGLITGGGFGWLSPKYGLAIDNLVQATVVIADGSVLVANDKQNSDLFWGIRGGGSNFGIVTEFILKVYPQRPAVYGGMVIFSPDKLEQIAAFLDDWWPRVLAKDATGDEGVTVIMARGQDGSPVIITFLLYNGSEEDGRAAFKRLLDIGPVVDMSKEVDYLAVNTMTNMLETPGMNYYFKGAILSRDKPSADLNYEKYNKIMEITKDTTHTTICVLEYLPNSVINSVPADATPYRRDLPGNILVHSQWLGDEPEKLTKARQLNHDVADLFVNEVGYGNYGADIDSIAAPGKTSPDKIRALFRDNYPRLQQLKKKYDPTMVFNKWYNVTPAE